MGSHAASDPARRLCGRHQGGAAHVPRTTFRLGLATTAAIGLAATAAAQSEPGATVVTHHETIPNPVFGSSFRVAAACKQVLLPCDWGQPDT